MLLSKVLVPLDGSEQAERVLARSGPLFRSSGTVALLRVVSTIEDVAAAATALDGIRDRLIGAGFAATARVIVGDPAGKIVQVAEETEASLIVLSTHGRSGVERVLKGSVAEQVIRTSPVPVLVAPLAAAEAELAIRKVLVPIDGTEESLGVLPAARAMAELQGASLVLLQPVDRPVPEKILKSIEEHRPDIVALTTHGRAGPKRWYLGSVAESVIRRAPCPVLVVRSPESVRKTRPRERAILRA